MLESGAKGKVEIIDGKVTGGRNGITGWGTSTIILGKQGEGVDITKPVIEGENGISTSDKNIEFYDGIVKGKTQSINETVSKVELGYGVYKEKNEEGEIAYLKPSITEVEVIPDTLVYNGQEQMPKTVVTFEGKELEAGKDYNVSYEDNIDAGTAKVIVEGTGDYIGKVEKEITIKPKELEVVWGSDRVLKYSDIEIAPDAYANTGIEEERADIETTKAKDIGKHTSKATLVSVTGGRERVENYVLTNDTVDYEIVSGDIEGEVRLTGKNAYNETLTANTNGISPNGCEFVYHWYYNDTNSTEGGTLMEDVTGETYTVEAELLGKYIYVVVEASKENYNSNTFKDITDIETNGAGATEKADPNITTTPSGRIEIVRENEEEIKYSRAGEGELTIKVLKEEILDMTNDAGAGKITIKGKGTGETKIVFETKETEYYKAGKEELSVVIVEANYEVTKSNGKTRYENKLEESMKESGKVKVLQNVDDILSSIEIKENIELDLSEYTLVTEASMKVLEGAKLTIVGDEGGRLRTNSNIAVENSGGEIIIGRIGEDIAESPQIEGKEKAVDGKFTFNEGVLIGTTNPPYDELDGVTVGRKNHEIITEKKETKYESRIRGELEPPTIEIIQDVVEITKEQVTLTVKIEDKISGVKEAKYTLDGETHDIKLDKNGEIKITVKNNCKIVIRAEDNMGNVNEVEYEVTNIDKTAGEVIKAEVQGITPEGVIDNAGIMIERIEVSAKDVKEILFSNNKTIEASSSKDWITYNEKMIVPWTLDMSEGNGEKKIYIWARDEAGNISEEPYEMSVIVSTKLIGGAGKNKVNLFFAGLDTNYKRSGLTDLNIQYKVGESISEVESGGTIPYIGRRSLEKVTSEYTEGGRIGEEYKSILQNIEGVGRLYIKIAINTIMDMAGNMNKEVTLETDVRLDTKAPTLSITNTKLKVTDAENNLMAVTVNGELRQKTGEDYGVVYEDDVIKAYDKAGNVVEYIAR